MLALGRVMKAVRLDDALHVSRARHVAVRYALVNDDVVESEVDGAISGNSGSDPDSPAAPIEVHSTIQEDDRGHGKDQGIEIIGLEPSAALAVMALVQKPAGPVHDPAMGHVSDRFHDQNRHNKQKDAEEHYPTYRPIANGPQQTFRKWSRS